MSVKNIVIVFSNKTQRVHSPRMSGAEFHALLAEIHQILSKKK